MLEYLLKEKKIIATITQHFFEPHIISVDINGIYISNLFEHAYSNYPCNVWKLYPFDEDMKACDDLELLMTILEVTCKLPTRFYFTDDE